MLQLTTEANTFELARCGQWFICESEQHKYVSVCHNSRQKFLRRREFFDLADAAITTAANTFELAMHMRGQWFIRESEQHQYK